MVLTVLKNANLTLAFLLELGVLFALGYWGFQIGSGAGGFGLGLAAPLLAIVVWAILGAPRSKRRLQGGGLLGLRIAFFGLGALAFFAASQPVWGCVFGLAAVVCFSLVYIWRQDEASSSL